MSTTNLNIIDLFCGCGGFSLGFERAGFNVLLGIDIWKDALLTFSHNHKQSRTLQSDLSTLDPKDTIRLLDTKRKRTAIRQYKAIGNAVPPVLMWHIANSLQRAFETSDGKHRNTSGKAQPHYAITMHDGIQGCVFEQEASYGHPPVSADRGEV